MSVVVAHIVAMDRQRVIGVDNQLPWKLSADLQHFKALTMGKPIVMGRKTWESIGRPLPGRENIVVSRQPGFAAEGAIVCASLDEAIDRATALAERDGLDELFIIGGATLYRQSRGRVDRIDLTEVDLQVDGDAHYPPLAAEQWLELSRQTCVAEQGQPGYAFVCLQRCRD